MYKRQDIDLKGKNVAVIGRSHIVGQPVSKLLTDQDATVTLLHSKSTNTEEVLKQADVIVSAVGRVHLVTKDLVKPGAVIIDAVSYTHLDVYKRQVYDLPLQKIQL